MNWSLLRLPTFRALWIGRLFSWTGSGIAPLALAFAALDLGADVVQLGLVVAARSVPNILLVLFGGPLTERLDRRMVAIVASIVSAGSLLAASAIIPAGVATLPLLAALGAVNGVGAAFFVPATNALLHEVVDEADIGDATVLTRVTMNIGLIVGTAAGGAVAGHIDADIALLAGGVLFLGAVLGFSYIQRGIETARRSRSVRRDLADGLGFVFRTPWLLGAMILTFVAQAGFAGAIQVLGPLAADLTFGRTLWGFAGAMQMVGMLVGAVVANRVRSRIRLSRATLAGGGMALPLVVLGLILTVSPGLVDPLHWFFWLALALVGASVGLELFTVPLDARVQELVPRSYLARVYTVVTLASLAGMPVGELAIGPLVNALGAGTTLFGWAALIVVVAVAVGLGRRVRRIDGFTTPG